MDTSLCNIPKGILVDLDIDGDLSLRDRSAHLLYRDGCIIHVEASTIAELTWTGRLVNDETKREKQLQIIMRLFENVKLKHNQALRLKYSHKSKDYKLVKKTQFEDTKITVSLWLPKAQINELQLIRWIGWNRSVCLWKGRQLDVDIAWASGMIAKLDKIMNGIKLLSQLDLCFQPIAHVLHKDSVIGLASERLSGRAVQYGDRSLIYEAISKLHRHRIVYHSGYSDFMIAIDNGKVRIIDNFHLFRRYEGPITGTEADWMAKAWRTVRTMFLQIITGEYGPPCTPGVGYIVEPILYKYYQHDAEHPLNNPKLTAGFASLRFSNPRSTELEAGIAPRRLERHRSTFRHDRTYPVVVSSTHNSLTSIAQQKLLPYISRSMSTSSSVTLCSASGSTIADERDGSSVDHEDAIVEIVD
ncbi:hypothetical protein VNI00_004346 [Paramarasmius palmivorus]|uniref:Uncharacterized protein n=1 Tax=Paramarasmius palmivorus TaxID=297713 RepID=A0AAW0DMG0_9AGAR